MSVGLPTKLPRGDTVAAYSGMSLFRVHVTDGANSYFITLDATNSKIVIVGFNSTTGVETGPMIQLDLQVLKNWTGTNKTMVIREFKFKDYENGCAEMKMMILATEPEAV